MKLKQLIALIAIFAAAPFNIFAATTQNVPPCPTLSNLGVSSLNSSVVSLPLWIPGTPNCNKVPSGETCYATWNLTKQGAAKGWTLFINVPGKNASDALNSVNNSGIFSVIGTKQSDSDEQWCKASVNGVSVDYFSSLSSSLSTVSNPKLMIENKLKS